MQRWLYHVELSWSATTTRTCSWLWTVQQHHMEHWLYHVELSWSATATTKCSWLQTVQQHHTEHQICRQQRTVLTGHHQQHLSEADLIHTVRQHHTDHRSLTLLHGAASAVTNGIRLRQNSNCPSASHRTSTDCCVELSQPSPAATSSARLQLSINITQLPRLWSCFGCHQQATPEFKLSFSITQNTDWLLELPWLSPMPSGCARRQLPINITQNTDWQPHGAALAIANGINCARLQTAPPTLCCCGQRCLQPTGDGGWS